MERRRAGESAALIPYLIGLGVACKYAARFTAGEAAYRRALDLLDAAAEPDLMALATVHHNLGGLRHAMGDHAAAEPYAARSVELRSSVLGADHPMTAADIAALAAIIDALGRHQEAEDLEPNHPELATTLNNLAVLPALQRCRHNEALLRKGHSTPGRRSRGAPAPLRRHPNRSTVRQISESRVARCLTTRGWRRTLPRPRPDRPRRAEPQSQALRLRRRQ